MDARDRARELLALALGSGAEFREGQLEGILALVDDQSRVLVVQRTGWGKSVVYFLATRMLRDEGAGPTILISPLLSLMRDQLLMAARLGIKAETINSTNPSDWQAVEERLTADEVDVLFVSPERLANDRFRTETVPSIARGVGMLVVDEAHCVSDWGHDFRPDYRRIGRIVAELPENVPLLATTATANDRVVSDVEQQLGPNLQTIRGSLTRRSLRLQNVVLEDQAERLAWLAANLAALPGSGIVYTLTVADARRVSAWLEQRGIDAPGYYADLDDDVKTELEDRLRANDVKALVATVALGMGFDKPDLRFILHFQRPSSAVAYYQQIGRAGRAVDTADVVLLAGREDDEIADFFIGGAFPPQDALDAVLAAAATAEDGVTVPQLQVDLNLRESTIRQCLKVLEIDGAVFREDGRYLRSANEWKPDRARVEAVTSTRNDERERMREFVTTDDCLMLFLARELDDETAEPCGRCANCDGPFLPLNVDDALVRDATLFLRRAYRPIEPRRRWPARLEQRRGNIPAEHELLEGRALSVYGDAGWGRLVKAGKYRADDFANELVDAAVEMIQASWQPEPAPAWVTAVPSLRDPLSVPNFAARLAERLDLPYRNAIRKICETAPQKSMQNSAQQVANIIDAFEVEESEVLPGAVLLVDDIVNSRWSLTICGVVLREAGSGPILPCVLATTSSAGSG